MAEDAQAISPTDPLEAWLEYCRAGWVRARMLDGRPVDVDALQRQADAYHQHTGGDDAQAR